jgi:hypothetical protein
MRFNLGAAALAAALISAGPMARAADGPIKLFNDKDLSGWKAVADDPGAAAATWSVKDGLLACSGKPAGYLRTDRDDFENYSLSLQWRWVEKEAGNNGLLVHATEPNALGVWPKSIEVQLGSGDAGDFWAIGTDLDVPDEATRKQDRRHINLTDSSEKPVGEWNTMVVVCQGDTIRVTVNGELVNEATHCTATKGAICLQSEGAPIEFRELVLTPLPR